MDEEEHILRMMEDVRAAIDASIRAGQGNISNHLEKLRELDWRLGESCETGSRRSAGRSD